MSLVEKYALLPDEIDRESLKMVEASLPGSLSLSGNERYVVSRIVRAEGDPQIALDVSFSPGAVDLGIGALRDGAVVVTDDHHLFQSLVRHIADGLVWMGFNELQTRKLHLGPLTAQ